MDHPSPSTKRRQSRRQEVLPLLFTDAQSVERFQNGVERPDLLILEPA